jgi:DNA helicase-4
VLEQAVATLDTSEYLAASDVDRWRSRVPEAVAIADHPQAADELPTEGAAQFRKWISLLSGDRTAVHELNKTFVARRLAEEQAAFDCVESYPLTARQRTAIVTNEDTTLVIAGAGTGKTSTIVGKVDYLVRRKLVAPKDILVLAFGKKASEEIKDRLNSFGAAAGVDTSTFHALGLRIVSQVDRVRPSLSKLAEDDRLLKRFIRDRVAEMLGEAEGRAQLILFLVKLASEELPTEKRISGDERIRAEKIQGLRALDGTKLKSNEEKQLANWFILNGIQWEYERPYPFPTATPWHRSYQPDFYLPEIGRAHV